MENDLNQSPKKKRWKGGRPRKATRERRSAQQNTRLSFEQREGFIQKANSLGLKPGDLARRLLLGFKMPQPIPKLNQQAWQELVPLVNDLRSLIHLIKSGQQTGIDQSLIENLLESIRQLRRELRGEN
jgi:hypothetical protein